jgi:hypothetical protein
MPQLSGNEPILGLNKLSLLHKHRHISNIIRLWGKANAG